MKRVIVVIVAILSLMVLISLYLVSCGGGGGGNGVEQQPPPPGGAGIGADGVAIFWYPYDTNIDIGAGNSVQETSDHGFVVAGYQAADFSSAHDVFLMKTDSRGTALWKRRFAWTGGAEANSVRQTSDGGYLVAGQAKMSTGNTNVYVLKTDALGNPAAGWPKTYGGTGNSVGYAALEVVNGYMIVGYRYVNPQENENVYVILTDTAGNVVRENFNYTSFCAAGGEIGRAIAVMPDGNYVIAGTTGCYGWKSVLLKIDSQDGHELWRKVYGTSAASSEAAYSVAVASDGFVLAGSRALVSGQPPVVGPLDALVIKTDQNGNELWRRTYGDSDQDVAFAVAPAQNNGSLVIGYTQSYGGKVDPNYSWPLGKGNCYKTTHKISRIRKQIVEAWNSRYRV